MTTPADPYQDRIALERSHFNENTNVHDLPAIFQYWAEKWIFPKLRAFGIQGVNEMFEKYLAEHCQKAAQKPGTGHCRFVSIGAGNCELETDLARRLRDKGCTNFLIECLELNPAMLARGRSAAEQDGVAAYLKFTETDVNKWRPDDAYDVVMASQFLHHVVNLEGLFEQIRRALLPGGQFVVADVIGRNGHLRWPEAMEIVQEYWKELPPSYRYNRPLKRHEESFEDWDCSTEGFEGIRAQDILPLLQQHFRFEFFLAFGNVIAPFIDRAFGHNFDAQGQWDQEFIDRVHLRDEQEMLAGRIKPTLMLAVLGTDPAVPTQYLAPFSPEFCTRWPLADEAKAMVPNPSCEYPELQRQVEEMQAKLQSAQRQIEQAANSRWVRLGRYFGLGPKLD